MALAAYNRVAQNDGGAIQANSLVEITNKETGLPAEVWSDRAGTVSLGSSFTTLTGEIKFYATPGRYKIVVSKSGFSATFDDELIGTVADGAVTRAKVNKDIVTQVADITELRALTGLVDGQAVEMLSYNTAGDNGGGTFEWRSGDQSTEVAKETSGYWGLAIPPVSDATGASGAWFRPKVAGATPFMFGCVGDGVTDDAAPLQAFFNYIYEYALPYADWSGSYASSQPIAFGSASHDIRTDKINGLIKITAKSAMTTLFTIEGATLCDFGSIEVYGLGSTSFASRTVAVGLNVKNSGRLKHGKVVARNFSYAGVLYNGTSTLTTAGDVKCFDCGSGASGYSLSGNWSNPIYTGTGTSITQRTTIDVDTLPPDYIINEDFGAVGDSQYLIMINGLLHYIYGVDDVAGTLTVYPFIPNTSSSGTYEYVFGGAVVTRGNDCNVLGFSSIDAIRCSIALGVGSLYGPKASRVTTQLCGVGIMIANDPGGATLGGEFGNIYFENNTHDIVLVSRSGGNAANYFTSEYALNLSKCIRLSQRFAGGDVSGNEAFYNNSLVDQGVRYEYEKAPNFQSSSPTTITPKKPGESLVWNGNGGVFNLNGPGQDVHRLTGIDSFRLICFGPTSSAAPTGNLTFTPPSGWSINGGVVDADLVLSGFYRPPVFIIQWNFADNEIYLANVSDSSAESSGLTGGTGSAGAGNQYVELEINGITYKVLHDGTV